MKIRSAVLVLYHAPKNVHLHYRSPLDGRQRLETGVRNFGPGG
jgi:hypothetical protein